MTPSELIAAFESLAEAPGGVACLRELIIQLAVRGRLVEQRPSDGSASNLVRRVLAEAEGRKIRVEVVHESRKPFDAPTSWDWVHLGDAMDLLNGRAFKPADWRAEGLRIVRIQNLNDPTATYNHCDPAIDERFCIESGCLLLSWSGTPGTSFGAFVWQGGRAALNQHIFRCQPRAGAFAIHFLRLAINSRLNEMIARAHGGVGLRHITKGKLEGLWLPVPPLVEQHRIVARVEELMGLLDRLEAARAKRETTRAAARDSVLNALREADSPAEVDAAWTRFAQRMDDLVCDPADIAPLRQTVLQLAVRGRLVPQDPKDEPAGALLSRVAAASAGPRKPHQQGGAPEKPVPFCSPAGWHWARFSDVASIASNLVDPTGFLSEPHVAPDNIEKGTGRLLAFRTIGEDGVTSGKHRFKAGQILYSKIRPNLSKVVMVDFAGLCSADMYPIDPWIDRGYLFRFMLSPPFIKQVTSDDNRLAMPKVNQEQLSAVLVPVPPLAEQLRIAARVDELMTLLERLEKRLTAENEVHGDFAAAAVHHLET